MCKVWITLDLFFCNNTCLHLAFINMDSFLRLKDPLRHGRVVTTCSLVLWLGASWVISFVQGIAQFMLSQADHGIIRHGVCFIADKNFLILGTLFSFLIPSVISFAFYFLCAHEIRALRAGKLLDGPDGLNQTTSNYGSRESLPEEASESTSCAESETEETVVREQVQLAVVADMNQLESSKENTDKTNAEEITSFCQHDSVTQHRDIGHTNLAFTDHLMTTDQSSSCTLLLRDSHADTPATIRIRPNAEDDHSCPDESLRQEIVLSRLMLVLLLFCISSWVPYSISNITFGMCQSCMANMTFVENSAFKWLAYSSAVMGPFVYLRFSDGFREAFWIIYTCKFCNKHRV